MQQSPFAILLFISSRIECALSLRGLGSTNSIPHAEDDHIVVPRTGEQVDACASIIAIAGTRDPEFVEDLPKEEARNLKKKKRRNTYTEKEEFVCELSSTGDLIPLVGAEDQLDDLRQYLNNGDLVSGETTIEGLTLGENAFMADGNTSINSSIEALLPDGDLVLKPGSEVRRKLKNGQNGRRLATYEGFKQVLVVRVTDKDGLAHSDKADVMSDKVFGTNGDPENMKTQFNACSFGKLTITNTYTKDIDGYLAAPGVIEVKIGVSLKNSGKGTIRNAVTTAVQSKIKYNLPGNFDHVIYVLQKCYVDCGWAAYAYVNSWNSVFQGNYYKMPAVQLHEIGHNLNLAHSGGLDGGTYTDHTCLMGNPLYSDTVGEMCYNPAKSFQIADAEGAGAWYQGSTVTWDTGTKNPTYWKGKVVGIADYDNNPEGHPVSIKLETGTTNDYFLGFNRAYRANKDNEQADDQVTIILTGNNGVGYSQSFLQATLVQGDSFTISKWHGTSYNLIITVNVIDISVSPGYADVTLNFGNASVPKQADQPTSQPTSEPTNIPTNAPTHVPTKVPTDQIPPSAKPSGQPSKSPTRPPTLHPTAKARKLQMK